MMLMLLMDPKLVGQVSRVVFVQEGIALTPTRRAALLSRSERSLF
jgi:hypothetical protein